MVPVAPCINRLMAMVEAHEWDWTKPYLALDVRHNTTRPAEPFFPSPRSDGAPEPIDGETILLEIKGVKINAGWGATNDAPYEFPWELATATVSVASRRVCYFMNVDPSS